jgi:hypothetical protein
MPHAFDELLVAEEARPGADGFSGAVEDPDDGKGEVADILRIGVYLRPWHSPCLGDLHVRKVRGSSRSNSRFRDVKAERSDIIHGVSFSCRQN